MRVWSMAFLACANATLTPLGWLVGGGPGGLRQTKSHRRQQGTRAYLQNRGKSANDIHTLHVFNCLLCEFHSK